MGRFLKRAVVPLIGVLLFLLFTAWLVTQSGANPFLYSAG